MCFAPRENERAPDRGSRRGLQQSGPPSSIDVIADVLPWTAARACCLSHSQSLSAPRQSQIAELIRMHILISVYCLVNVKNRNSTSVAHDELVQLKYIFYNFYCFLYLKKKHAENYDNTNKKI